MARQGMVRYGAAPGYTGVAVCLTAGAAPIAVLPLLHFSLSGRPPASRTEDQLRASGGVTMDQQDADSRQYPPFVTDADQRRRWDCACASAEILF